MNATLEPITEETAFVVTDAGMDALRLTPAAEGEPDAFTPDTKEKADWVLGKIADARGRAARIREHAEVMAKQAEADAAFLEWKFGAALQSFARQQLEGGKRKSLTLYNGTLGFRTKPAGVTIGDGKAALEWARENLPEAVVETIDRKAVADALLSTGESVPFAALDADEEVFYIK